MYWVVLPKLIRTLFDNPIFAKTLLLLSGSRWLVFLVFTLASKVRGPRFNF